MKVIKKGNGAKGWSKEMTCTGKGNQEGGCGAKLFVEQADVFRTSSGHYDGSTDYYTTIQCPECGVLTDIADVSFDIPDRQTWLGRGGHDRNTLLATKIVDTVLNTLNHAKKDPASKPGESRADAVRAAVAVLKKFTQQV
jgi:hypothetical protein